MTPRKYIHSYPHISCDPDNPPHPALSDDFYQIPSSSYFYDVRAAPPPAVATSQRYCSTVGDHNNPNSRRNGDISDDSIRDLDGGNFPRWA